MRSPAPGVGTRFRRRLRSADWRRVLLLSAMAGSLGLLLTALLAWQLPYGSRLEVRAGDVSPINVVAPQRLTFASQVLTDRAREHAAEAVPEQYDTDEDAVRRQQVSSARQLFSAIDAVRSSDATLAEKTDRLVAFPAVGLTAALAVQILSLTDDEWRSVMREAPLSLDRVMRDEIRESSLSIIARRVPMLVSSDLSEPASDVTIALVRSLIRPNSVVNDERTAALQEAARAQTPQQMVTLEQGEMIIRSGDVATLEQAEALTELNKLQRAWDNWIVLRAFLYALVVMATVIGAIFRLRPQVLRSYRQLALLLVVSVVWLLAAKFMLVNHPLLPYFYPLAAMTILVAVLTDLRVSVALLFGFGLVLIYFTVGNTAVVAYAVAGAMVGMLVVGRGERLNTFLWAALALMLTNVAVMAAFNAPFPSYSNTSLTDLLLATSLNGVLCAAIALIGYFVLSNLFGITSPLQLAELSRPTHPLLQQLLLKASGTYHHTILVSNMAERAAAAIGADALLVRVGAYYHDIGKTVRPYFFAENIMDNSSPHEMLDPQTSAQIIISHVKDGVDLAQKYHLPERLQDFIREHHGQSLVRYFYVQAQRQAQPGEQVNEAEFRYPGPKPHSKETAILLLADTCEAAVRAVRPTSREELAALVNRLIDERVISGELDASDLTFKELQMIKNVFLQVLQGVHHPRIVYPEPGKDAAASPLASPGAGPGAGPNGPAMNGRSTPGGVEEAARPAPIGAAAEG